MNTTLILRGGLGNQMFQYALAIALRAKGHRVFFNNAMYGIAQMHNGYELDRVFGVEEKMVPANVVNSTLARTLVRFHPTCLVASDSLKYNDMLIHKPKRFINGYWQDERYFKNVAVEVKDAFRFKHIDDRNLDIAKEMYNCNSVSLHVRRGDYATFGMSLMNKDYYFRTVEYVKACVDAPRFYIFSDDTEESEKIAKDMGIDYSLICHNTGNDSYKDMFLMSQCKHNIIANSSFSWWGAWLNMNGDKIVVAPKVWDAKRKTFHPQLTEWILL